MKLPLVEVNVQDNHELLGQLEELKQRVLSGDLGKLNGKLQINLVKDDYELLKELLRIKLNRMIMESFTNETAAESILDNLLKQGVTFSIDRTLVYELPEDKL